jgi:prepilin peptidase CpaA
VFREAASTEQRATGVPMDSLQQQLLFTGGSLLCAGIGSIYDVRTRRIPNRITGPAVAAGLLLHGFAGGWSGLGESVVAGLIAGGIFLLSCLAGGMGAGDVKLMVAVGCIAGLSPLLHLVTSTAVFGGVLALAVAIYHGRLRETLSNVGAVLEHHGRSGFESHPEINLANANALRLPFAVPVAAGCLFTFCVLAWEAYS